MLFDLIFCEFFDLLVKNGGSDPARVSVREVTVSVHSLNVPLPIRLKRRLRPKFEQLNFAPFNLFFVSFLVQFNGHLPRVIEAALEGLHDGEEVRGRLSLVNKKERGLAGLLDFPLALTVAHAISVEPLAFEKLRFN